MIKANAMKIVSAATLAVFLWSLKNVVTRDKTNNKVEYE
jgi:hypothetical protein